MECTRRARAKNKLQNVGCGPPPSTVIVLVSVVRLAVEIFDRFISFGSEVAWTLAFTGALVSHP